MCYLSPFASHKHTHMNTLSDRGLSALLQVRGAVLPSHAGWGVEGLGAPTAVLSWGPAPMVEGWGKRVLLVGLTALLSTLVTIGTITAPVSITRAGRWPTVSSTPTTSPATLIGPTVVAVVVAIVILVARHGRAVQGVAPVAPGLGLLELLMVSRVTIVVAPIVVVPIGVGALMLLV